jgi:hypothetical protein
LPKSIEITLLNNSKKRKPEEKLRPPLLPLRNPRAKKVKKERVVMPRERPRKKRKRRRKR